ncbi:hypothetical protein F5051DRAFT_396819 [Lentinula edodes]|nr:hypothetical protein F5051DRAFT_396819 [Lentinula edodes]
MLDAMSMIRSAALLLICTFLYRKPYCTMYTTNATAQRCINLMQRKIPPVCYIYSLNSLLVRCGSFLMALENSEFELFGVIERRRESLHGLRISSDARSSTSKCVQGYCTGTCSPSGPNQQYTVGIKIIADRDVIIGIEITFKNLDQLYKKKNEREVLHAFYSVLFLLCCMQKSGRNSIVNDRSRTNGTEERGSCS